VLEKYCKYASFVVYYNSVKYTHRLKSLLTLALWGATLCVIGASLLVLYAKSTVPDPGTLATRQVKESTKIYDRTGTVVLYDIYNSEKRTVVPWDKISDNIKNAVLAAEDNGFYQHPGFDVKGILRSIYTDLTSGSTAQGGSTITQQLVGNALVGRQKTIIRKIQELILAVEVEQRFTKDQIFEMYLNQIPFGSNIYGVEAASQAYFGVSAADLSPAQAAALAAMIQRPSYLSPSGSHVAELLARKDYVLTRMHDLGSLDDATYQTAKTEKLVFQSANTALAAPHFVMMVQDYVTQRYGEDMVDNGGLKIVTTLDADLQKKAEDLVTKYATINAQKYNAKNAALVSIDPKTGDVLALVGSAKYSDIENEGNYNVILSPNRQPGSAFKPFAYAVAFQKGYPDTTVLWDVKTEFNPLCPSDASGKKDPTGQDCYHPKDYNGQFSGPVTMRQALDQSLNVPAVETLYLAGIDDTMNLAEKMGITTLNDRSRFGLSLVLGGAEVKPIDLASAYGVFANDGVRVPWGFVQSVESNDGTVLESRATSPERVLDSQTSRMVSDVLSDNNARAPVFGVNNALYLPGRQVAAKTGTTQENRDAWVVGYTPSIVTGVWVGNNHNESMTAAGAGISAAGPLWNAFMSAALQNTPAETFVAPDPVLTDKIMLNGSYTSSEYPQPHSILFYVSKDDPSGSIPTNPAADPQFMNWESAVQQSLR
jgi:1A family penicillin-binding protein